MRETHKPSLSRSENDCSEYNPKKMCVNNVHIRRLRENSFFVKKCLLISCLVGKITYEKISVDFDFLLKLSIVNNRLF